MTADLRGLLKKDALFQWSEAHDVAFQKIKNQMSEDVCLRYFDTTKEVVLQVDISQISLGAVLLQDGMPVAYASKALTPAEMRYANIEREMPCSSVWVFEIPPLPIWQKVCMQVRPSTFRKNPFKEFIRYTHQDYKDYYSKYNHMILKSSTFQVKRLHLQMPSVESTSKTKWS